MQVLNLRIGFASNSSSTHSTVIANNKCSIEEYLPVYFQRNEDGKLIVAKDFHGFNWEDFVLTEQDTLDLYIAAQIWSSFPYNTPNVIRRGVIQQMLPHVAQYIENWEDYHGVDHQSQWTLPSSVNGPQGIPDIEYLKDLIDYLHKNDIVITGGNDNGSYEDFSGIYDSKSSVISKIPTEYTCDKVISYKDGDVWVVFNKENGWKIRVTFNDSDTSYTKSSKPELIDLIISNRCAANCSYCYRDCTPYKPDAPLEMVQQYIDTLADKLHIPEIIIGGGDIVTYPYLEDLCDYISWKRQRGSNSVFNTTISITPEMLCSSKKHRIDLILNSFNGVAISVPRYHDQLKKLCGYFDAVNPKAKISFQFIPELEYDPKSVIDILSKYKYPVTLLGFKECGRAAKLMDYKKKEIEQARSKVKEWLGYAEKELYWNNLAVDTQFLKNFPEARERWDKRTYTTEEGKFSCCIDATDNTISSSSYSNDAIKINSRDADGIAKAFQSF